MQVVRGLMLIGVAVLLGFGYSGCKRGAGEKAGEAVDKAAQDAGAAVGEAVQTAGRSAEKAGKEVQKSAR